MYRTPKYAQNFPLIDIHKYYKRFYLNQMKFTEYCTKKENSNIRVILQLSNENHNVLNLRIKYSH